MRSANVCGQTHTFNWVPALSTIERSAIILSCLWRWLPLRLSKHQSPNDLNCRFLYTPVIDLYLCDQLFLFTLGLLSYQNFIEIMMETMQAMTHWGKLKTVLEGYVGFDTVQEQIRKKSLKRGFEFNLMVVGELHVFVVV